MLQNRPNSLIYNKYQSFIHIQRDLVAFKPIIYNNAIEQKNKYINVFGLDGFIAGRIDTNYPKNLESKKGNWFLAIDVGT